jgi:hypothetical protein
VPDDTNGRVGHHTMVNQFPMLVFGDAKLFAAAWSNVLCMVGGSHGRCMEGASMYVSSEIVVSRGDLGRSHGATSMNNV